MTTVSTRTIKQARWDLFKQEQRAERAGLRTAPPCFTAHDAAEQGRAARKLARRRAHQKRRTQRVSADHHASRVESKRLAHKRG